METFDPQVAARVWQRVQQKNEPIFIGQPAPPVAAASLDRLIRQAWQCALAYQALSRRVDRRDGAALRSLARQKQAQAACLKGLCAITGEGCPARPHHSPRNQPPATALRQCYGMELQALQDYEALSADPRQGQIYGQLAQQQKKLCLQLVTLLGTLAPAK